MSRRLGRQSVLSGVADLTAVLLFVVLGRTSHDEGTWLAGVAATAAPFLVGTAVGWGLLLRLGWPLPAVRSGLVVLGSTVVGGMLVRAAVTGRAVPLSFVVVATLVLALLMLGWRAVSARAGGGGPVPPR